MVSLGQKDFKTRIRTKIQPLNIDSSTWSTYTESVSLQYRLHISVSRLLKSSGKLFHIKEDIWTILTRTILKTLIS